MALSAPQRSWVRYSFDGNTTGEGRAEGDADQDGQAGCRGDRTAFANGLVSISPLQIDFGAGNACDADLSQGNPASHC